MLPVADRLWPNCLNRPIRNAGKVNIDDFVVKMNKSPLNYDAGTSEKIVHKTAASRTQNKKDTTPIASNSQSVQSLSSESQESPKSIEHMEMRSDRIYANGIRRVPFYLKYLF